MIIEPIDISDIGIAIIITCLTLWGFISRYNRDIKLARTDIDRLSREVLSLQKDITSTWEWVNLKETFDNKTFFVEKKSLRLMRVLQRNQHDTFDLQEWGKLAQTYDPSDVYKLILSHIQLKGDEFFQGTEQECVRYIQENKESK